MEKNILISYALLLKPNYDERSYFTNLIYATTFVIVIIIVNGK